MALKEIKKAFEQNVYRQLDRGIARDESSKKHAHNIKLNIPTFSAAMVKGINAAAKEQGLTNDPANSTDVSIATTTVINRWKNGKYGKEIGGAGWDLTGVRAYGSGNNFFIQRLSRRVLKSSTYARKVNQAFRAQVVEEWNDLILKKLPSGIAPPVDVTSESLETIGKDTGLSHSKDTSVANAGLVDFIENSSSNTLNIEVQSEYSRTDIAQKLLADLGINWKRSDDIKKGRMEWIIEGELGGRNPKPGDPDYVKDEALTKAWNDKILKQLEKIITDEENSPFTDAAYVACKPFTHKIATWEQRKMADEFLKVRGFTKGGQKIKVKNVPKKPKNSKQQGAEKNKNPTIKDVVRKIETLSATLVAKSKSKEKGQGKQANTNQAKKLAQDLVWINRRLTHEVERNMGRDGALTKRKGRFSRSVELKSLHQAAKTIVAKYTYMLSPYSTFENTGKRRWRLSYNPKTLIAKSIRNLAQGRIKQKLTVRRV